MDTGLPNLPGAAIFEDMPVATAGNAWLEYLTDAYQRSALFLDILRQRGDQQAEMAGRPMATVLRFKHEQLISGQSGSAVTPVERDCLSLLAATLGLASITPAQAAAVIPGTTIEGAVHAPE